jgi:hypothetical protein
MTALRKSILFLWRVLLLCVVIDFLLPAASPVMGEGSEPVTRISRDRIVPSAGYNDLHYGDPLCGDRVGDVIKAECKPRDQTWIGNCYQLNAVSVLKAT